MGSLFFENGQMQIGVGRRDTYTGSWAGLLCWRAPSPALTPMASGFYWDGVLVWSVCILLVLSVLDILYVRYLTLKELKIF